MVEEAKQNNLPPSSENNIEKEFIPSTELLDGESDNSSFDDGVVTKSSTKDEQVKVEKEDKATVIWPIILVAALIGVLIILLSVVTICCICRYTKLKR